MKTPREQLYLAVTSFRLLWGEIYEDWAKSTADFGLTVTEESILWILWSHKSSTVTELAQRLQRDKGTISKSIYSLEENGFVSRKYGENRRSFRFDITETGEDVLRRMTSEHARKWRLAKALDDLSDKEREVFLELARKLAEFIAGELRVYELQKTVTRICESAKELGGISNDS